MKYWEKDSNTVILKFFGVIGDWYQGAIDFTNTFEELEKKYKNIEIQVHCYGGNVVEGNVIFNAINQSKANVIYNIVGVSASMSTICQMGANKVTICENGLVMVHRPGGQCGGNADDMFAYGKLLKSLEANFAKCYSLKKPSNKAEVKKWFDGSDHWFTAEEALALGLVDEIVPAIVKDVTSLIKPTTEKDAEAIYLQFAATLDTGIPNIQPTSINHNQIAMKKLLIQFFALTSVNEESSDTAIAEAIKAKFAGTTMELTNLQSKYKALNESQGKTLIAAAETAAGKIFEPDQKTKLEKLCADSGIEALSTALSFVAPAAPVNGSPAGATTATTAAAPSAVNLIANEAKGGTTIPTDRASWDWATWCEKDEKGLLALSAEAQNNIYKKSYNVDMPKG